MVWPNLAVHQHRDAQLNVNFGYLTNKFFKYVPCIVSFIFICGIWKSYSSSIAIPTDLAVLQGLIITVFYEVTSVQIDSILHSAPRHCSGHSITDIEECSLCFLFLSNSFPNFLKFLLHDALSEFQQPLPSLLGS